mgnify:CR=1 FL=1
MLRAGAGRVGARRRGVGLGVRRVAKGEALAARRLLRGRVGAPRVLVQRRLEVGLGVRPAVAVGGGPARRCFARSAANDSKRSSCSVRRTGTL